MSACERNAYRCDEDQGTKLQHRDSACTSSEVNGKSRNEDMETRRGLVVSHVHVCFAAAWGGSGCWDR